MPESETYNITLPSLRLYTMTQYYSNKFILNILAKRLLLALFILTDLD